MMFYGPSSAENSSASASDYDEEYDDDNIDGEPNHGNNDNESDNDDARSNASYGENLRVRSLFSLEALISNDKHGILGRPRGCLQKRLRVRRKLCRQQDIFIDTSARFTH